MVPCGAWGLVALPTSSRGRWKTTQVGVGPSRGRMWPASRPDLQKGDVRHDHTWAPHASSPRRGNSCPAIHPRQSYLSSRLKKWPHAQICLFLVTVRVGELALATAGGWDHQAPDGRTSSPPLSLLPSRLAQGPAPHATCWGWPPHTSPRSRPIAPGCRVPCLARGVGDRCCGRAHTPGPTPPAVAILHPPLAPSRTPVTPPRRRRGVCAWRRPAARRAPCLPAARSARPTRGLAAKRRRHPPPRRAGRLVAPERRRG